MKQVYEPIEEDSYKMAIRTCKAIRDENNTTHIVMAMDFAIDSLKRQIAKKVEVKDWSPSFCPTCRQQLSTDSSDGYYTHPDWLERCPNVDCCQRLKW